MHWLNVVKSLEGMDCILKQMANWIVEELKDHFREDYYCIQKSRSYKTVIKSRKLWVS